MNRSGLAASLVVASICIAPPVAAMSRNGARTGVVAAVCAGDLGGAWAVAKSSPTRIDDVGELVATTWLATFFRDPTLQKELLARLRAASPGTSLLVDACSGKPIATEWREIVERLADRSLHRVPIPAVSTGDGRIQAASQVRSESPQQPPSSQSTVAVRPPESEKSALPSEPPGPPAKASRAGDEFRPAAIEPPPKLMAARLEASIGLVQIGAVRLESSVEGVVRAALKAIPHLVTAEDVIVARPKADTGAMILIRLRTPDPTSTCRELSIHRLPCLVAGKP